MTVKQSTKSLVHVLGPRADMEPLGWFRVGVGLISFHIAINEVIPRSATTIATWREGDLRPTLDPGQRLPASTQC